MNKKGPAQAKFSFSSHYFSFLFIAQIIIEIDVILKFYFVKYDLVNFFMLASMAGIHGEKTYNIINIILNLKTLS